VLITPFIAGLIAGKSDTRPVLRGALACALAWLMLIMGNGLASGYFPALGRDFVPSAFVVAYSAAAGALGAWIEARGRESEIA